MLQSTFYHHRQLLDDTAEPDAFDLPEAIVANVAKFVLMRA